MKTASWPVLLGLAAGYFVLGWAANLLAIPPGYATAVWPAAGLAMGAVLGWGAGVWPGILLGAFLVNFRTGSAAAALAIAAGSVLQALAGARLTRRFAGGTVPLAEEKDIAGLLVLGGPVACLVSASVGVLSLRILGAVGADSVWRQWWTWWVGDSLGVILVAPLVVLAASPGAASRRRAASVFWPAAVMTALAAGAYVGAQRHELNQFQSDFAERANDAQRALEKTTEALVEAVQGLRALYDSSKSVEEDEFKKFVRRPLERHPDIVALEWVPRVAGRDRAAFEAAARRDGHPGYRVVDVAGDARVPAPPRPEHYPVRYMEPLGGNEAALGFDLASRPERRALLERARDSGEATVSGRVSLVQRPRNAAVLLAVPVYRAGAAPSSAAERRRMLEGFAVGIIVVDDLLSRTLAREGFHDMLVRVYRGNELLFQSGDRMAQEPVRLSEETQFADTRLRIVFVATPKALDSAVFARLFMTLAGAVLFCGLFTAFLLLTSGRSESLSLAVEARTRELAEANRRLSVQHAIAALLAAGLPEEVTLTRVMETACVGLGWDHAAVWTLGGDGRLACAGVWGTEAVRASGFHAATRDIRFAPGVGLPGRVLASGDPAWIPDVRLDGNFPRAAAAAAARLAAAFAVPVRVGGKVSAVIEFMRPDAREADEHLLEAMSAVAGMCGSYLERLSAERLSREARRRAADEMSRARDAAMDLARTKSEFLANMSHEIRTPLNAVIGLTQLLSDTPLSPEQRRHFATIKEAGEALLALVDDVLDFSKMEAGKMTLEHAPFDLNALLRAATGIVLPRAQAKGLSLECLIEPEVPRDVKGDAARLRQVLLNLLSNAVKFTSAGSVTLKAAASPAPGGVLLRVSVADTGIGMEAEVMDRLFNSFSQADASTSRRYGGSGLGLAISKGLVDIMGGTIGVRSVPGTGSTFWFEVPLEAAAPSGEAAPAGAPGVQAGLRVLVVEDNPVNRSVAEFSLRKLGCGVECVPDGRAAVERVRAGGLDVVFIDSQMPGLDGPATAREIRRLPVGAGLVLIAMTASALEEERRRCLEAGMDDFMSKPFRLEDLSRTLARWSRGRA